MKLKLGLLLLSLAPVFADGTQAVSGWGFGTELQAYPAGLIPGARLEYFPDSIQNVNLRLGYNFARRQDFGRHSDERGAGWGGGIGYRRYGFRERLPFFAGFHVDWWELAIDWQQNSGSFTNTGRTNISVLQPTFEAGFDWRFSHHWSVILAAAIGAEINVQTRGEAVGEGAIFLLSVAIMHRL
ncbi:MAG: hypothetical protein ACOY5B_02685 [Spirochaetota bacterium]